MNPTPTIKPLQHLADTEDLGRSSSAKAMEDRHRPLLTRL